MFKKKKENIVKWMFDKVFIEEIKFVLVFESWIGIK